MEQLAVSRVAKPALTVHAINQMKSPAVKRMLAKGIVFAERHHNRSDDPLWDHMGSVTLKDKPTKFSVCVHCDRLLVTNMWQHVSSHLNTCKAYQKTHPVPRKACRMSAPPARKRLAQRPVPSLKGEPQESDMDCEVESTVRRSTRVPKKRSTGAAAGSQKKKRSAKFDEDCCEWGCTFRAPNVHLITCDSA